MATPDLELIETGKTGGHDTPHDARRANGRDRRGRFAKGYSGNLAGRPRGIPNPAARAALLLDSEAEALAKKAVELALAGDPAALRLCLDRVLGPRRGRPVPIALPPIDSAADLAAALAAVAAAASAGTITAEEALALAQTLMPLVGALAARKAEARQQRLAAYYAKSKTPGAE